MSYRCKNSAAERRSGARQPRPYASTEIDAAAKTAAAVQAQQRLGGLYRTMPQSCRFRSSCVDTAPTISELYPPAAKSLHVSSTTGNKQPRGLKDEKKTKTNEFSQPSKNVKRAADSTVRQPRSHCRPFPSEKTLSQLYTVRPEHYITQSVIYS